MTYGEGTYGEEIDGEGTHGKETHGEEKYGERQTEKGYMGKRDTERGNTEWRYKRRGDTRERETWIGKYKEETYGKERAIQNIRRRDKYGKKTNTKRRLHRKEIPHGGNYTDRKHIRRRDTKKKRFCMERKYMERE